MGYLKQVKTFGIPFMTVPQTPGLDLPLPASLVSDCVVCGCRSDGDFSLPYPVAFWCV